MHINKLLKNEDAVSISIGFILMFAITTIVFTAVIISFNTLSQSSEKSAMIESFDIIGEAFAIKIITVDTLINIVDSNNGSVNFLEYEFSLPESIASKTYTINITNSTNHIIFESDNGARSVTPFNISSDLIGQKIYSGSGNYKLIFNNNTKSIYIAEQ